MKPGIILSMEQALSMTYATLRFVQMGWRVIKLEATPRGPNALPGDPNRYIGDTVVDSDRRSYFVAPNVGKEAIALNLKTEDGQAALRRIISELDVDVFCCNTLPGRYPELGIDYDTLKTAKNDLIWAGISAMGPDYPNVAGYDPAIQAMVGYMDVTGEASGPPMLAGIPLIDLKAGDEVFAQVWVAIAERLSSGEGRRIDVSMLKAAASWLITLLPLIDFDCEDWELFRAGNEHRKFVPTNAYQTSDGAVLIAVGSDSLWQRFINIPMFAGTATEARVNNQGRVTDRVKLHADIDAATSKATTAEVLAHLREAKIPSAPINTIRQVMELAALSPYMTTTHTPEGKRIRMQPKAVEREGDPTDFSFPPNYGQHTRSILAEVGYDAGEIDRLVESGVAGIPRG